MAEFLNAFIPTFAFMLVPIAIPVLAVAIGSLRDLISRQNAAEPVDDRVRARVAQAA